MSISIDVVSREFSEFIKSVKDYGFIRITPLVNVDAIIASSILLKTLYENGFNVAVSFKPYIGVKEPAIYLDLDLCKPDTPCLSILYGIGSIKSDGLSKTIYTPYSLSATVAKTIEKIWVIDAIDKSISIVGGIYRNLDLNKEGFKGLESTIVKELGKSGRIVSEVGFRFWGWKRHKLLHSLAYTLKPYIPGLTSSLDKVREVLTKIGVGKPDECSSGDILANSQLLKKLASEIISLLRSGSKKSRNPAEVIGRLYFIKLGDEYVSSLDLYSMYEVLSVLDTDYIVNLIYGLQDSFYLENMMYLYESIIDKVVEEIAYNVEFYRTRGGPCIIESRFVKRPDVYTRIFDELGVLGDKVVCMKSGDRLYTSLSELLRTSSKIDYNAVDDKQFIEMVFNECK